MTKKNPIESFTGTPLAEYFRDWGFWTLPLYDQIWPNTTKFYQIDDQIDDQIAEISTETILRQYQ